jgi:hypothetical protein
MAGAQIDEAGTEMMVHMKDISQNIIRIAASPAGGSAMAKIANFYQ